MSLLSIFPSTNLSFSSLRRILRYQRHHNRNLLHFYRFWVSLLQSLSPKLIKIMFCFQGNCLFSSLKKSYASSSLIFPLKLSNFFPAWYLQSMFWKSFAKKIANRILPKKGKPCKITLSRFETIFSQSADHFPFMAPCLKLASIVEHHHEDCFCHHGLP